MSVVTCPKCFSACVRCYDEHDTVLNGADVRVPCLVCDDCHYHWKDYSDYEHEQELENASKRQE